VRGVFPDLQLDDIVDPFLCRVRHAAARGVPAIDTLGVLNRRARRALVEAAWTYRYPARVSDTLRARLEGLPKPVRDIAWKAQVRLCGRYRRLSARGKKLPVVVAAIAREMAAFLWAIGREIAPA
jgi:hypothetical protein